MTADIDAALTTVLNAIDQAATVAMPDHAIYESASEHAAFVAAILHDLGTPRVARDGGEARPSLTEAVTTTATQWELLEHERQGCVRDGMGLHEAALEAALSYAGGPLPRWATVALHQAAATYHHGYDVYFGQSAGLPLKQLKKHAARDQKIAGAVIPALFFGDGHFVLSKDTGRDGRASVFQHVGEQFNLSPETIERIYHANSSERNRQFAKASNRYRRARSKTPHKNEKT